MLLDQVVNTFHKLDSTIRLSQPKFRFYQPKIRFSIDKGHYTLKIAESHEELQEVLKLRYEVYYRELLNKNYEGIDTDHLDSECDHLLILDNRKSQIIGTYRLFSTRFCKNFYSQKEFDLQPILDLPGEKLEMGRACVHKDYRSGIIMALLWRGIAEYIQLTEARYLFGSASIRNMNILHIALIYHYIKKEGMLSKTLCIPPYAKNQSKELLNTIGYVEQNLQLFNFDQVGQLIPSLVWSYLKIGGKFCGIPAHDAYFKCFDFLTVVDIDKLPEIVGKKYKV